jgi:hypothetical protein
MTLSQLNSALKAVLDSRYPLEPIAQTHHYVSQVHKRDNEVITVKPDCV